MTDISMKDTVHAAGAALAQSIDTLGAALDADMVAKANALAGTHALPLAAAYGALVVDLRVRIAKRTATEESQDGREAYWRTRVRLFKPGSKGEPEADSDPDLGADMPGSQVIAGLPGVAAYLLELATGFHGGPCVGLDMEKLKHRLKGLRPTLSRRGGNGVWRVPYHPGGALGEWLARVDVERVQQD